MDSASPREIHYRVMATVRGQFPGRHRSSRGASGFEFRGHASLLDVPDPRRLDLHASLRDPMQNWLVRVQSERRSIPVTMVADLSASMGFEGACPKLQVVADFAESLSWSAWRNADSFGFVGCDTEVREAFLQPQTRSRGAATNIAERLRRLRPEGRSARGLLEAHRHLSRQRSLVFLLSDFHLALPLIEQVLNTLAVHDVVPVILWDRQEFALSAGRGLARVVDPETGHRRLIWWRPALRQRWLAQQQAHREALLAVFQARRLAPLFLEDGFDADAVTRYFYS
jgi:Mg-chelatase subunit ChlD